MSMTQACRAILTAFAIAVVVSAPAANAQEVRAIGPTPPRLSFIDGEVSYWRPGAEDWVPAQVNTALAAGDSVYAGNGGNAELEIATRAYVRAGSGTELGIESLETGYLQLRVPSGHAAVDLRRLPEGQQIEVGTPNGAFLIDRVGYYRLDVDEASTRFAVRRGGSARVVPAGGEELVLDSNQEVVVRGTETAAIERIAATGDDAWDRWNVDRTAQLGEAPRSAAYVPPDVAGVDDLDRYGDWRDTPSYGHVWVPRNVDSDWAPYTTGRWVWDGYYGWTWVDDSPWGWAPYHYGRWCWNDGYWGWAPGPVVARSVYSPALVAFFGGHHGGVSVSVGTPFVSWVALGWGEPVVPWWGPRGFVGRAYWGGWGGPRVVNNVVINNTTIVNVNNINRYDNFRNRRAVIGVDGNRFGRGRVDTIRVDSDRVRNLRPVRGELAVRPVRESLTPGRGRGERPPDRIQNRRVVATRAPQDPARQPRAAGLVREGSRRQAPEPRIVTPRTERGERRGGAGDVGRSAPPPVRGRGAERATGRGTVESPTGGTGREVDRNRGRERGTADVEQSRGATPPATTERGRGASIPRERDRNGRDVGTPSGRSAARPPAPERGRQQDRGRSGGDEIRIPGTADDAGGRDRSGSPQPPARERGRARGSSEIQMPREQAAPPANRGGGEVRERGRDRGEQPQRAPSIEAPRQAPPRSFENRGGETRERSPQRVQQPERQRSEQPQRQMEAPRREAPQRNERQSQRDQGRSADRGSAQRQAPPERQQAEPRTQRGGGDQQPANARGGGGRGDGRSQRGRDQ